MCILGTRNGLKGPFRVPKIQKLDFRDTARVPKIHLDFHDTEWILGTRK